jgi:hypothetical protein
VYAQEAAVLAPIAGNPAVSVIARHLNAFPVGDNVTNVFRVRSLLGYDSFSLSEWDRLWHVVAPRPDTWTTVGATHVVSSDPPAPLSVTPLPSPRGHAWWTNRVSIASTADDAAALLPAMAAGGGVALEAGAGSEMAGPPSASTVAIDVDVPGRLRASVTAPEPGWLVFTEIIYPGWTARVNGEPVRIARAFGALQAVPVPAGTSTVEFAFRPTIVLWGAATSLLGLALAFVVRRK